MFGKAKHMVGAVLMGAATGAVAGAVKGAVEAGGQEVGISKESENEGSWPKGKTEEPNEEEHNTASGPSALEVGLPRTASRGVHGSDLDRVSDHGKR
jgi:predicted Rossmann-fold nucleotide-binding protein